MTINQAIWNVISTQYKKDMAVGALEMVKAEGYTVTYRGYGEWWEVINPKTNKSVSVRVSKNGYNAYVELNKSYRIKNWQESKIDFKGYLDKPFNREWYVAISGLDYEPTRNKYSRLTNARWSVKYETERVERLKKEIASKQKDLENAIRAMVKDEIELTAVKRELGLIK